MPRDSGGTYTLVSGNPVISGTVIASTWANTTMDDLAAEMTDSLSRTGSGGMQAPLKFTDGSESNPSQTFTNDPLTGRYLAAVSDMRDTVNATDMARYTATAVELNYAGSKKFETVSDGVTVFSDNTNAASIYARNSEGGILLKADNTNASLQYTDNVGTPIGLAIGMNVGLATDLYYNGVKKFETNSVGANVAGTVLSLTNSANTANSLRILNSEGGVKINNDGGQMNIQATNSAGTALQSWVKGVTNGATSLFYNGVEKFETTNTGVKVTGDILLPNEGVLLGRNSANSVDINIAEVASNNTIVIGDSTSNIGAMYFDGFSLVITRIGGIEKLRVDSNGIDVTGIATSTLQPTAASHLTRKDYVDGVSDVTWKENINPLENAIETVNKWAIKKFDWKEDAPRSGTGVGPIAQELEKVNPELVRTSEYKHLDRDSIIGYLIKSVQELSAEIELLKAN